MNTILDARPAATIVLGLSAATLGTALAFQYWGGLAPCVLCHWQRYAHAGAVVFALLALGPGGRTWRAVLLSLSGLALVVGAGIALFHVGVEQHWWQGTAACGSTLPSAASVEDLRQQLLAQPVVRCDEVAWSLFGISMAGYNLILSLVLAMFALAAAKRAWQRRKMKFA